MKTKFLCGIITTILFASCDHGYQPNNGVSPKIAPAIFKFSVNPESKIINIGDTLTLKASLPANYSDSFVFKDGTVQLPFTPNWLDSSFIITKYGGPYALINDYFDFVAIQGMAEYNVVENKLIHFLTTDLINDSFRYEYKFVFKKKGVYQFSFENGYLNASNGKTYATGHFLPVDHHWSFIQNGLDTPTVGSYGYDQNYLFGVQ